MTDLNFAPWEDVPDVDYERRTPQEWAKIYSVKLVGQVPDQKVSEYEWAYLLSKVRHFPAGAPDTPAYERYETMSFRAERLRLELFKYAEPYERELLNKEYVETKWVHNRLR